MGIEAAIGIHTRIQQQADVIPVAEDAIQKRPTHLAEFLFALGVPKQVLSILVDRNIGMHATTIHAHHGFGQK